MRKSLTKYSLYTFQTLFCIILLGGILHFYIFNNQFRELYYKLPIIQVAETSEFLNYYSQQDIKDIDLSEARKIILTIIKGDKEIKDIPLNISNIISFKDIIHLQELIKIYSIAERILFYSTISFVIIFLFILINRNFVQIKKNLVFIPAIFLAFISNNFLTFNIFWLNAHKLIFTGTNFLLYSKWDLLPILFPEIVAKFIIVNIIIFFIIVVIFLKFVIKKLIS